MRGKKTEKSQTSQLSFEIILILGPSLININRSNSKGAVCSAFKTAFTALKKPTLDPHIHTNLRQVLIYFFFFEICSRAIAEVD